MIGLKELSRLEKPPYLEVSEDFMRSVRDKVCERFGSMRQFAIRTKIVCDGSNLGVILRGEQHRTSSFWIKLTEELDIPRSELERHITKIMSRDNKSAFLDMKRVPIHYCPKLALLVGHSLGDGHINHASGNFSYTNTNYDLQNVVLTAVDDVFGFRCHSEQTRIHDRALPVVHTWTYPKIVGDILHLSGSPRGNKITQSYGVPEWIIKGDDDTRKSFIRALFDDEGTIKTRGKELLIKFSKEESKMQCLHKFMDQLAELLRMSGVETTSVRTGNIIFGKNGKTIQLVLGVHGYKNFKSFNSEIGFDHSVKSVQMAKLINSYEKFRLRGGAGQKLAYEKLIRSKTAREVACKLEISPLAAYKHLRKLEAKGLVKQIKGKRNKPALWMKK
ncbi:MAG: hypothetical protein FJY76_03295 [Candidatus Aenigmarchaeota archaeon]|nr:hypothetical protein [Candidatus Aenigmarchaeota archaeon]